MWLSRPIFGHGIDQYRVEARRREAMPGRTTSIC